MRNPARSVAQVPRLRAAGAKVRAVIDQYLDCNPAVATCIAGAMQSGRAPDLAFVPELAERLARALGVKATRRGSRSAWRHDIVRGFVESAGDPDTMLADWLENGAPTGVAVDVRGSGVFPQVDAQGASFDGLQMHWARIEPTANNTSVEEHRDLVKAEIGRLASKGFVTVYPDWKAVQKRFGHVVVSKMAAIAKLRPDRSTKLRLIIDMRRSFVNSHVRVHERIVLPRLQDLLTDAHALHQGGAVNTDAIDMMVLDWEDAFHSMGVLPEEFPHQIVKGFGDEFIGYETVLFGGGGSPAVWGRAAAFLGRSGQALFAAHEARLQVYVDDPWSIWAGTNEERLRNKVVLLAWWLVLGPPISWKKIQAGRTVKWISAVVALLPETIQLSFDQAYIDGLLCGVRDLAEDTVPKTAARKLAGRAEWVAGVVPYLRAHIAPLWAARADMDGDKDRIPSKRIRHSLSWLESFFSGQRGTLVRTYPIKEVAVDGHALMEFDASPWGLGGVLYVGGRVQSWFAEAASKEDMARFNLVVGSSKDQALLEALAILIGVRLWCDAAGVGRWALRVRSDSQAALGAILKMRSRDPRTNCVVRELTLDLAEGRYELGILEHIPGLCNFFADKLSRFYQPGSEREIPMELAGVPRAYLPRRAGAWWRAGGPPASGQTADPAGGRDGQDEPPPKFAAARVAAPWDIRRGGPDHDLEQAGAREALRRLMQEAGISWFAPPCSTFSRAGGRPVKGAKSWPMPLRSAQHPYGRPDLAGPSRRADNAKVIKENSISLFVADLCKRALFEGRGFVVLQPADSFLWLTPEYSDISDAKGVIRVEFSYCAFEGGSSYRPRAILTNVNSIAKSVAQRCPGGRMCIRTGAPHARNRATERRRTEPYPQGLLNAIAGAVLECAPTWNTANVFLEVFSGVDATLSGRITELLSPSA